MLLKFIKLHFLLGFLMESSLDCSAVESRTLYSGEKGKLLCYQW